MVRRLEIKKIQCDINRVAENISALSSREIGKYEYLEQQKYQHYHLEK